MPLYRFVCVDCSKPATKLLDPGEQKQEFKCVCGGVLERNANPPSSVLYESLDNGAMPKRLERLQNAEQLYKDRADADPRKHRV